MTRRVLLLCLALCPSSYLAADVVVPAVRDVAQGKSPSEGWWLPACLREFRRAADEVTGRHPELAMSFVSPFAGTTALGPPGGEGVMFSLMSARRSNAAFVAEVRIDEPAVAPDAWSNIPRLSAEGAANMKRAHEGRVATIEANRMSDADLWGELATRFRTAMDRCLLIGPAKRGSAWLDRRPIANWGWQAPAWFSSCNLLLERAGGNFSRLSPLSGWERAGSGQDGTGIFIDRSGMDIERVRVLARSDYSKVDTGWASSVTRAAEFSVIDEHRAANLRYVSMRIISRDGAVVDAFRYTMRPILERCLTVE